MSMPGAADPASYLTIARSAQAAIEVKRSRFLATLVRVEGEPEAREAIAEVRRTHPDARHHCMAMVLGPDGATQRSSDDGEPAGTAGAPMLEVLRGAEVSDTVVVVTRWFGGVLLGAGGLVRAYGDAVREGLRSAGRIRRNRVEEVAVLLPHADAARVETEVRARGVAVLGVEYADSARLLLGVPPSVMETGAFAALLGELTGGRGHPEIVGSRWLDGDD